MKRIKLLGAEDSLSDSFVSISSTKREIYPPKEDEIAGLYLMDVKTQNFNNTKLSNEFKEPFAPHSISLR